jgi:peptidyl-Asp metalloendopeptidase
MKHKNVIKKTILSLLLCLVATLGNAQSCVIHLLVAYTDDVADSLQGDEEVVNAIKTAVNSMNTIYIYSAVDHQIALVRTVRLNAFESSCFINDLNAFQSSRFIDSLRIKYHADVAALVVGNHDFCGLPYYDNSLAVDSTAYCAVNFNCMINNFSLSHQVAHLYGCGHVKGSYSEKSESLYPYGNGYNWSYNDAASFNTIMAIGDDDFCGGVGEEACNLIPYFSNPNLEYQGVRLGMPGLNDNARVLNQNAAAIGSIQLLPVNQLNLSDTINLYNIAIASAKDTLATGSTYRITDSATVKFESGKRIVLNPGFNAAAGVHFETILYDPKKPCGQ